MPRRTPTSFTWTLATVALVGCGLGLTAAQTPAPAPAQVAAAPPPAPPSAPANAALKFERQEIRGSYGVGYAITTADMNADRRPDVVAISGTQVTWYENPSWKEHVALEGQTPKDNVAFAPHDIDRDGRMDVALAAAWNPRDTMGGGTLHWVQQGPTGAAGTLRNISSEPTLHRIRWADVDGRGGPELIAAPLHGRGTAPPEWNGQGARLLAFTVPAAPATETWPSQTIDDTLHIVHNFTPVRFTRQDRDELLVASREGLHLFTRADDGKWSRRKIGEGAPGEIKVGRVGGRRMLATVEPWHGTSVVVYREPDGGVASDALWPRTTIDPSLTGGHALAWADLDGDGDDELVAGWREGTGGVVVYDVTRDGALQSRTPVDLQGMTAEDVAAQDLDGDGKPEIVASGRKTSNVVIYWNRSTRR
ncbi:MAG TPA: VCBS repeat-containing protein [Luteitalea sp.]|nr:VCBS repeat-containing protein [Luteitalea sp.]